MITRTASIPADRPERWAKQMLSHFSAKVEVTHQGHGGSIQFGAGIGRIRVEPGILVLEAEGETAEGAEMVKDVLGRHFARFAAKEGLTATWTEPG